MTFLITNRIKLRIIFGNKCLFICSISSPYKPTPVRKSHMLPATSLDKLLLERIKSIFVIMIIVYL